jgi:hypothetical protein
MSNMTLAGIALGLFGLIMAGDAKMFGFKTAAPGIAVAGVGLFLGLFGYFGSTESGNREPSGRRIRDHSV